MTQIPNTSQSRHDGGRRFVVVVNAPDLAAELEGSPGVEAVVPAANLHDALGAVFAQGGASEAPPTLICEVSDLPAERAATLVRALQRIRDDATLIAFSSGADSAPRPADLLTEVKWASSRPAVASLLADEATGAANEKTDAATSPSDCATEHPATCDATTPASATVQSGRGAPLTDAGITGLADEGLLPALERGVAPMAAACQALLRQRTGRRDLHVCIDDADRDEQPSMASVRAELETGGSVTLSGGQDAETTLAAWIGWLVRWIEAAAKYDRLCRDAFTDELTGAWNRRYFRRHVERALRRAHDERLSLTLMMLDVDDLKDFNDRYGHAAGDEVLIETVRLLQSVIRPHDRVCRIGGDEFVVVFYDPEGPRQPTSQHPREVEEITARFQAQIAQSRFPKLGRQAPGPLTVSGGIATYPWDGVDLDTLLQQADRLALEAKRKGKNAIVYGPNFD
jgi:two-component system cell cycle response regulator